jgi:FtsH-binding integral membrane protein
MGAADHLPGLMRRVYGAHPLHLLAHAVLLPVAAFAILELAGVRAASNIALWFVAAVVLHDLLLLPASAVADRAIQATVPRAVNFVRVPAALSALLLLVFFPLICGRSDSTLEGVSGVAPQGYAERWLLVTAALFAVSAALYLLRRRRPA